MKIERFDPLRDSTFYKRAYESAFAESYPGVTCPDQSVAVEAIEHQADLFAFTAVTDEPVGCVVLSMTHFDTLPIINIDLLFVAPNARGTGTALALLDGAEHFARNRGISILELQVTPSNASAVRLYQEKGYAITRWHMAKVIE